MIDFNLDSGSAVKSDDAALILQQIDLLFDTKPKELLGEPDYGSTYDEYLYKLKISNSALQYQVESDLHDLELFDFVPTVEVHLLQGTEQDIALIDIVLTRDEETYRRIYKIS